MFQVRMVTLLEVVCCTQRPETLRQKSRKLRIKAPRQKAEMPMWASPARAVSARETPESELRKDASRYLTLQGLETTHVGLRGTKHLEQMQGAARCANDQQ